MSVLNWAFKAKGGVISAIKKSNIKTIYYGLFFREHWRSWSLQKFIVIFFFWKSLWEAFGLKMREKSKMQAFSLLGIERSSNVMLPLREPAFSERWNSVVTDSFFYIFNRGRFTERLLCLKASSLFQIQALGLLTQPIAKDWNSIYHKKRSATPVVFLLILCAKARVLNIFK